jgi:hypothetical protein
MSSRALRRAQQELEERQRIEKLSQLEDEGADEDEDDVVPLPAKSSMFALLGEAETAPDQEDKDEEEAEEAEPVAVQHKAPRKNKKKNKKGKNKGKTAATNPKQSGSADSKLNSGLDDIDRALLALKVKDTASHGGEDASQQHAHINEEMTQLFSVLSVDTQHLHAANEMRKLFGRAAVQANNHEDEGARRQGRRHGGVGQALGAMNALGHRNTPLSLRRNIFIQGKEDWPRATTGGLGMEVVLKRNDGTVEYRFVHNTAYQSVQRQFDTCVASMNPDRMIQLLQFNPYHIATLLQVSEIAKQQREIAAAGDFLERALFSFGRAVHSTFASNIAQGKARLDFRRPENREFWLAAWRYVGSLGVRATWRTAFEWAKLLLSLDPEGDPYCIRLSIDQLALRGREPQSVVDLRNCDRLERLWKVPPNLAMSVALAYNQLKEPEKARSALRLAIEQYPWMAARLCKELEISPIPKPIWGKEPSGNYQELLCQLYVTNAKDLWNTPEATSLLFEVASSCKDVGSGENPYWLARFHELKIGRHVILSEERTLLSLLDPRLKEKYRSTSDPLPPADNLPSYSAATPGHPEIESFSREELTNELFRLQTYFTRISNVGDREEGEEPFTPEELEGQLEAAGTSMRELRRNTDRFRALRDRLELGHQFGSEGEEDVDSHSDA